MPISKFEEYQQGLKPKTSTFKIWPLYGSGLENMGFNGETIQIPIPAIRPDELLVRHDACGLCFSDIKIIKLGENHPRIYRKMADNPVVLGHEVAMTVVDVGENLKKQYKPGDRFIIQADIYINGVSYAYGYEIQGGLSEYNVIDQRILNGDHGNYLIPLKSTTGYAESALIEPWACVIAAYHLQYRSNIKPGGVAWFIGPETRSFSLSAGFSDEAHPGTIKLTQMDGVFGAWLRERANALGIQVVDVDLPALDSEPNEKGLADDIVLLAPSAGLIERMSPYLAYQGILAFTSSEKLTEFSRIDVGRIHYNRWLLIGGTETDIALLYNRLPTRSALLNGGNALFVGAGGPMGRMHVQHAIETANPPATIVCSDVSNDRLKDLSDSFANEAAARGIQWLCVNPVDKTKYEIAMRTFRQKGFDDIIVLAPVPAVISESARWLGQRGVMNIFAGVARGTTAEIDLNDAIFNDTRIIGHSGSVIENMMTMLNEVESGQLSSNRSVAAVGSMEAVKDGLQALMDATFPGKVVIYPNIKPLPLTSIADLKTVLPEVYAKLKDGREWTCEAEQEFLEAMLP